MKDKTVQYEKPESNGTKKARPYDINISAGNKATIVIGDGNIVCPRGSIMYTTTDDKGNIKRICIPVKLMGGGKMNEDRLIRWLAKDNEDPLDAIRQLLTQKDVKKALDAEDIKIKAKEDDVIRKLRNSAIDNYAKNKRGRKSGAIMVECIADSFKGQADEYKASVRQFAKQAPNRFFYFLSAITSKQNSDQATMEYRVAKELKKLLGEDNVFWWEDPICIDGEDKDLRNSWLISTKIAMGLGFSSVFIGLAFDTVEKEKDLKDNKTTGKYVYKCLLSGNDAYKTPNYFEYEVLSFINLRRKNNLNKFLKNVVSKDEIDSLCDQKHFRLFSLGEPDNYERYSSINNTELKVVDECFESIRSEFESNKTENEKATAIATIIFNYIQEKQRKGVLPTPPHKIESVDYLFAPYDPATVVSENIVSDDNPDGGKYKFGDDFNLGSKENIDMVPSDFFFEYAVIDEGGNNAKNHFLIYPEYTYDDKGNIKWSINLVVRDWNMRGIKDFIEPPQNGNQQQTSAKIAVGLEKLVATGKYTDFKKQVEASKIADCCDMLVIDNDENCSIDRNSYKEKGGVFRLIEDVFTLMKHETDAPFVRKLEFTTGIRDTAAICCYYAYITFIPKKIIRYRVVEEANDAESKNKVIADFLDEFSGEISVEEHYKSATYRGIAEYGKPVSVNDVSSTLVVCGKDANRYLLLRQYDENQKNGSDKKDVKDESKTRGKTKNTSKEDELKCPYCGQPLSTHEFKDNKSHCPNNFIYDALGFDENNQLTMKSIKVGTPPVPYRAGKSQIPPEVKPEHQLILNSKYERGAVVSLVGPSQSGKSTFLHGLLGMFNRGPNLSVVGNALKPYVDLTNKWAMPVKCPEELEDKYNGGLVQWRLGDEYKVQTYGKFVKPTQPSEINDIAVPHIPYLIETGTSGRHPQYKKGYLSFFDVPGGFIGTSNTSEGTDNNSTVLLQHNDDFTMLTKSDAIVIFVNDTQTTESGTAKKVNLDFASKVLSDVYKIKSEKSVNDAENCCKKTLLAVVLCKLDEFAEHYKNGYSLLTPPVITETGFEGSERQKYIDMCSEEIKQRLMKDQIEEVKEKFERFNVKFFGISAIGRSDSIYQFELEKVKEAKEKSYKFSMFHAEQRGIENILLWIMYQRGMIR